MAMDSDSQQRWNQRYRDASPAEAKPMWLLQHFQYLLPPFGTALDLACGYAGNARLLHQLGLETSAWDISDELIGQLTTQFEQQQIGIATQVRDAVAHPPAAESFDVITVGHFLERSLFPSLIKALRPNGLLFYQTFSREQMDSDGPSNPAFRLAANELLHLTAGLRVRVFFDQGQCGDLFQGLRNESAIIAQRVDDESA